MYHLCVLFKLFAHKLQCKQYETQRSNEADIKAPIMNTNSCPFKKKGKSNNETYSLQTKSTETNTKT